MVVEGDYIVVPNGNGEGEATFDMIAATVTTLALECKTGLIMCEIRTWFLQQPEFRIQLYSCAEYYDTIILAHQSMTRCAWFWITWHRVVSSAVLF